MVRMYSRKKVPMKRVLSKKVYDLSGGATLTPRGAEIVTSSKVSTQKMREQSIFSENMKQNDTIRKMIEELKYDGTNLARYNERKDKARTLRENAVSVLQDTNLQLHKIKILIRKYKLAIGSIHAFIIESNISMYTGDDENEILHMVIDCRKSALEAIKKTLNKDNDYLTTFFSKINT